MGVMSLMGANGANGANEKNEANGSGHYRIYQLLHGFADRSECNGDKNFSTFSPLFCLFKKTFRTFGKIFNTHDYD